MDQTPNHKLPYILAAQAQKHVTHNEALRVLDAILQLSVLDRNLSAPPANPVDGERYIVGPSGSGDWTGHDFEIAAYQDNAWAFYPPSEGWTAWVSDEDAAVVFNGNDWVALSTGGGGGSSTFKDLSDTPTNFSSAGDKLVKVNAGETALEFTDSLPALGVNDTPDATNKLKVSSSAVLLDHDGTDMRAVVNKNASTDIASFLFQTSYSGRAEIGLAGDDDFHFKVSPDGSTFHEAILIDKDDGSVSFPNTSFSGSTDADAIHDNVAGEIATLSEKASPVSTDVLIVEDSADSNNKKKVQIGNLPSSGGGSITRVESDLMTLNTTDNISYVFAHGLGQRPDAAGAELECINAANGYAVGDRITSYHWQRAWSQQGTVCMDDTEVEFSFDDDFSVMRLIPRGGGTATTPSNNWALVLWAEVRS